MTSLLTLCALIWIYSNVVICAPSTCTKCLKSKACNPPKCFCCRDEFSLSNITLSQIPQMVFFTFDDAVTEQVAGFYKQLFQQERLNPNGCPISMTLFISHDNTKYGLVSDFHKMGMEIASHSVTHSTMNSSNFFQEAKLQKENLARLAGIPISDIKGWRSPFLKPTGDLQPNALQKLGYTYDATLTFSKRSHRVKPPGPFTLDFGYPYECQVDPCPKNKHPGFWEVPIVSLMDYKQAYDCVYVDGCMNAPPDEESAYQFLWDNFQNYYSTTRMPFGINMHSSWFFYPDRLKAMDSFIKKLVSLNDVYIISAKKVLEWLKIPTPLQDLHSFKQWACDGSENEFHTRPLLVKTNIERPLPPRAVRRWTPIIAHDRTLYAQPPAVNQQETIQTKSMWSDAISNRRNVLSNVSKPEVKIFLDINDLQWRPRTEWSSNTHDIDISSRVPNQNERLHTLQNTKLPVDNTLTLREQYEQHEERMRQLRAQEALERQQEVITERRRQQQELLAMQQQELSLLNRQTNSQPIVSARADARLQQTVQELPIAGQNFGGSKENIMDVHRENFNKRLSQDLSRTVITPAPIRLTDFSRDILYTDAGSRFEINSKRPTLGPDDFVQRPGLLVTTNGTVESPHQRQDRLQGEHARIFNEPLLFHRDQKQPLKRQDEHDDRALKQQRLPRDKQESSARTMLDNILNFDRRHPSLGVEVSNRDRHEVSVSDTTRDQNPYIRGVLYPTSEQQMAWNNFIRKLFGQK